MLDEREKMQIAEIVSTVIDHKLTEMRKEVLAGFVEVLDWHNDNFAKIMQQTNDRTVGEMMKAKREVIEIRTREYEERKAQEVIQAQKSARRGFTAKAAASAK
jgi:hypothetical protein